MARPAPERELGVDYPTAWARSYPARLARAVLLDNLTRPLVHVVASPKVRGAELLELIEPPAIFVANHASHVDTPLLLSVLPPRIRHRTVVAAAADHFFDRRWKAHLWALALAAVPIERQRVNRRSAELATELLRDGWNLVIYPEGGRTPDGWFGEFHPASVLPAVRTGRPVVPVHIEGTHRILPREARALRRHPTTITFAAPLRPSPGEDPRHLAERIGRALAVLADEQTSDFWSALRRQATRSTPSPRGPDVSAWRRAWALQDAHGTKGRPGDTAEAEDEGRWALSRRHSARETRSWRNELARRFSRGS